MQQIGAIVNPPRLCHFSSIVKTSTENIAAGMRQNRLFLDLETTRSGRIRKVGAVFGDRVVSSAHDGGVQRALSILDRIAGQAECLAGHNIVDHDLPALRHCRADLKLLQVPVIDTLYLSPICFPENPYHCLVKDYKLVSETVSDPVEDARLAATLFEDEIASLIGIRESSPELFKALHLLTTKTSPSDPGSHATGMRHLFRSLGADAVTDDALECVRGMAAQYGCRTAAVRLDHTNLTSAQKCWALAFVLTWLRVSGSDSVIPPWVRHRHPSVSVFLHALRDVPCDDADCRYCAETHSPEKQLKRFFGFDCFRPTPHDGNGGSLQRRIVLAGMQGESLLAILPTGGGKSLCYQLPALVRSVRRGQLTVVISPLQALMKDQVDGLQRRTGLENAAALYGLLTPPERGDVLRRLRTGDIAVLYVSPEQLRNASFTRAISQREVGCWVVDEAHCLSKWGHDFRPDYLYIGRFMRELAKRQGCPLPPVACFTATAKRDVAEEIMAYFQRETAMPVALYQGGVERENLCFEVQTVSAPAKLGRIDELLHDRLDANGNEGSAIVFRTTRRLAEETAEYLCNQGWQAAFFHAGMTPPEKKRTQDAFLDGELRVICATNAFGMGIDKDDVRLVVHGDSPASIENYLQEAGRAGRDRGRADCVLLYDEEDCEQQFRLGAFSELSRRDIAQILRGLRKATRTHGSDSVVITTGELMRDEDVDTTFGPEDLSADTKVRAAMSWLERAGFVERNQNRTNVFQARLLVRSTGEAEEKLAQLGLSDAESRLWLAIVREMINAGETDSLTVDGLALLPEFQGYLKTGAEFIPHHVVREGRSQEYLSSKVLKVLNSMTNVGIMKKDTLLTAFIAYKVANHSRVRFDRVCASDREMLKVLMEEEPDPEGWLPLNLRLLNQTLLDRDVSASPPFLRRLLRSLSEDGKGFSGQRGSIELRHVGRDAYRVRLRREWAQIAELAERRRRVAGVLLDAIVSKVPSATPPRADLLVEFSFEELTAALNRDLALRSDVRDMQAAIERGLMFLHEQNVIVLQQGLAVFRSAMTVRVLPESKGLRYTQDQYQALEHHYRERVFQVHVMNEYARYGIEKIQEALALVVAYFTMEREAFIARFFGSRRELLERATTARSYRRIVDALGNREQIRIVTAPLNKNMLILAGPGSGKTRTVVHRCAYLLRVKRVRPSSVLVCCFNHKAALELRRRLAELVGRDACGVTVQTYHGLALRLLGFSCSAMKPDARDSLDFDRLIVDAVDLLEGGKAAAGLESDETRDRLLAGYEHILVDEYQDIDEAQYHMIGAIAGRTLEDGDRKLTILAVGDDDQSIYGFRGANVTFIRRFCEDFEAATHHLVENYRSTRYIIEAANSVIARNRDRMKCDLPIRVDEGRQLSHPGGAIASLHPETNGRVAVVSVRDDAAQAVAAGTEIERLRTLGAKDWSRTAILSRTRRDLSLVRVALEAKSIPVQWPLQRNKLPSIYRMREVHRALGTLREMRSSNRTASELFERVVMPPGSCGNAWAGMIESLLSAWQDETGNASLPVGACVDFLYESLAQRRRDEQFGVGVVLNTVHAAKGTEYDHVILCGDWSNGSNAADIEEERRVFYVGMTRARHSLCILDRADTRNPFRGELVGPCFAPRHEMGPANGNLAYRDYTLLGLDDMFLDFAGRQPARHRVHEALSELKPGASLQAQAQDGRVWLVHGAGTTIGALSAQATELWRDRLDDIDSIRVVGMYTRLREDIGDRNFLARIRCDSWEVPVCEVRSMPAGQD